MSRALYQLPAARGLKPGTKVVIDGPYDYAGEIVAVQKERYDLSGFSKGNWAGPPHGGALSLYLIRGLGKEHRTDIPYGTAEAEKE
jgi:hypothetical protein